MTDLDDTDRAILRALVADATQGAGAVGRALGLSQPAAWRRIRRLEEAGVIAGRRIGLDAAALGFGVTVFLGIKLASRGRVGLEDFERAATAIPEVQTVQHVLGLYDYRLRVTARDLADFERVLLVGLAKDKHDRPEDAREFERMLDTCGDAYQWRAEDSRTWWRTHGEAVREVARLDTALESRPESEKPAAMGVDMSRRTTLRAPDDE